MGEVQLMLPGEIVKKDNQLIRTRVSIDGVVGGRILASMIACLKADGNIGDEVSIAADGFLPDLPGGAAYTKLKNCVSNLGSAFAELVQYKSEKDFRIEAIPFFARISYYDGKIIGKFNSEIYSLLIELKKSFTKYNLVEFLQLPSIYSQRIFEILKSYENLDNDNFEINLLDLHRMLNCPDSMRKNFKDFRRFILEKAELDINKKTTLRFDWEPIKTGRKVTAIRFIFTGKKQKKLEAVAAKVEAEKGKKAVAALAASSRTPQAKNFHQPQPLPLGDLLAPEKEPSLEEKKRTFREQLSAISRSEAENNNKSKNI